MVCNSPAGIVHAQSLFGKCSARRTFRDMSGERKHLLSITAWTLLDPRDQLNPRKNTGDLPDFLHAKGKYSMLARCASLHCMTSIQDGRSVVSQCADLCMSDERKPRNLGGDEAVARRAAEFKASVPEVVYNGFSSRDTTIAGSHTHRQYARTPILLQTQGLVSA